MKIVVVALTSVALAAFAQADSVVITDTDFVGPQWSSLAGDFLEQNDCGHSDTRSNSRQTSGGTPGAYLRLNLTVGAAFGPCFVLSQGQAFHAFTGITYNPAVDGAITSLDYSDSRRLDPASGNYTNEFFRPALKQGSQIFVFASVFPGSTTSTWSNISLPNLTAANFRSAFSAHPDFSASGAPIQFGVYQAGQTAPTSTTNIIHNLDNFRVDIHRVASNPCPADLNDDGFVDDVDFVLFAQAYDAFACSGDCPADFNADSFVDDVDFVLFAQAYDTFACP